MRLPLFFILLASPFVLLSDIRQETLPMASDREINDFMKTLMGEIQKQKQFVDSLQAQINRKDILQDSSIVFRYGNAVEMLTVKKTLYANFINTPSIQSPLIRQKLLSIFQKELITAADLSELQALVNQERPKYIRMPAPPAPTPPPVSPQPSSS